MDTVGLYGFVLGGAVFHAVSNIAKKKFVSQHIHVDFVTIVTMLGAVLLGYVGSFALYGIRPPGSEFWTPLVKTGIFNIFIQYLNVIALKLEDASVVVPLSATMPLFAVAMSYAILGEWPTPWGRVGIPVIALGAYVLYLGGKAVPLPAFLERTVPKPWQPSVARWAGPWLRLAGGRGPWLEVHIRYTRRIIRLNGAQLALFTAYLGSISVNFDKLIVIHSDPLFATASKFAIVALAVLGYSWWQGVWQKISKESFPRVLAFGVVYGAVDPLYNAGFFFGIVPYVAALKRTQIFWSVLLACFFLKEGHFRQRIVGAAILFLGAVLLAF